LIAGGPKVFPPHDLTCPHPAGCPVTAALPELPGVLLSAGKPMFRCYDVTRGYDEFNPGFGDSRFAPFDSVTAVSRVSALYLADNENGALLETVFHEVHQQSDRHIYEKDLRRHAIAHLLVPTELWLVDLRDDVLQLLGIRRDQVVASPSEHYPCTRQLARDLQTRSIDGRRVEGVLWHSRQAELLRRSGPSEVCVVFGDVYGDHRGSWTLTGPGARNLYEGPGRLLIDELANELAATVHPIG
jgi:hypothetical protein